MQWRTVNSVIGHSVLWNAEIKRVRTIEEAVCTSINEHFKGACSHVLHISPFLIAMELRWLEVSNLGHISTALYDKCCQLAGEPNGRVYFISADVS